MTVTAYAVRFASAKARCFPVGFQQWAFRRAFRAGRIFARRRVESGEPIDPRDRS